jgi:hypothetical protein
MEWNAGLNAGCLRRDHSYGSTKGMGAWQIQDRGLLGKQRYTNGQIVYKIKCPVCLRNSGALPNQVTRQWAGSGTGVWVRHFRSGTRRRQR